MHKKKKMIKNILVIGGAGFIGSNLVKLLLDNKKSVYVIDNLFSGKLQNLYEGVPFKKMDAKDINEAFPNVQFECVYHLGEYSRVEQSFEDIDICLMNNTSSFPAVISYCRKNKSKLIYSASSTIFAKGDYGDSFLSPYTMSKQLNVNLLNQYAEWNNFEYAIVYFYNAYGPKEISTGKFATVIGKYLNLLANGKTTLPVTAPGTQTRNFTHVQDIVSGLKIVGERGKGDGYMIGSDHSYSILDIVKILGTDFNLTEPKKGNRIETKIDCQKIKDLGWFPKIDLKEYLENEVSRLKIKF